MSALTFLVLVVSILPVRLFSDISLGNVSNL